mgnify:FL=1
MALVSLDNDEPGRRPGDVALERLKRFVLEHEVKAGEMLQNVEIGAHSSTVVTDATTWDAFTDVIKVDLSLSSIRTSLLDTMGATALHNALFHRTTLVLASLTLELKCLADDCHTLLIPPLALATDPDDAESDDPLKDEEVTRRLGHLLTGHLQDVWNWIQRATRLVVITVRQFACLYSEAHRTDKFAPYQRVHFPHVWHCLFELLGAMVLLEEVITTNEVIEKGTSLYRRIMENVKKHPERYEDIETEYIEQFGKLLHKLDCDVFGLAGEGESFFDRCVNEQYDLLTDPIVDVSRNEAFFSEFTKQLQDGALHMDGILGTPREGDRRRYIGVIAAFVLYSTVFRARLRASQADHRKLGRSLYDLHRKASLVHIVGSFTFVPSTWMSVKLPDLQLTKDAGKDAIAAVSQECVKLVAVFPAMIKLHVQVVTIWSAQMSSTFPSDRVNAKPTLKIISALLERGLQYAEAIRRTLLLLLATLEASNQALTLPLVEQIFQCVYLLQMIRHAYVSKTALMTATIGLLSQSQTYVMQRIFNDLYHKISHKLQVSNSSIGGINSVGAGGGAGGPESLAPAVMEALTDQQCGVAQALALVCRPPTRQALVVLDIVMSIAFDRSDSLGTPQVLEPAFAAFATLTRLSRFQSLVVQHTNCDFLYWLRGNLMPLFLGTFVKRPETSNALRYLIHACHD